MSRLCPGCSSADLHISRDRSLMDRAMRAIGLPPRRCSACGWRGYLAQTAPAKRADPVEGLAASPGPVVRQATVPRLRWSLTRIIFSALLFGAITGLVAWILSGEPQ